MDELSVLSLCSGYGGLDLGIRLAEPGARTVCYCEREAYVASLLVRRMEEEALDSAPIWDDLRTFPAQDWRGKVSCVSGSYPCQPFSSAGKRRGADDERHLWPAIANIVRVLEPAVCFFENVAGHLSLGFEEVADDLQGMGFRVAAGLFTAEEVGLPHRRERLFIMAHAHDYDAPRRRELVSEGERTGRESPLPDNLDPPNPEALLRNVDDPDRRNELLEPGFHSQEGESGAIDLLSTVDADGPPLWFAGAGSPYKPCLCGMVDGSASRVDRSRAIGNGVVPLVVAHAWRTLQASLKN